MQPRYQCYVSGATWGWRLLGSNNRVLARGVTPAGSAQAAVADALAVAALAADGRIDLVSENGSAWRWRLAVDHEVRAVSAVPYARRLECVRAVTRFRGCAPGAPVTMAPTAFPGPDSGTGRRQWVG